jgi:hypothetical protein
MSSIEIIICTEKGRLESEAMLPISSLRNFGVRLSNTPIYSYLLRKPTLKDYYIDLERRIESPMTMITGGFFSASDFVNFMSSARQNGGAISDPIR